MNTPFLLIKYPQPLIDDIISILEVLAWPTIVLIVFLILRKPLKVFIGRIKSIGIKGAGIEAEVPKKQSASDGSTIEKLIKETPNKNLERIKSTLSPETLEFFKSAVLNESNVDSFNTAEEREGILFSYSQLIYMILQFNKIYVLIYGSQIRILQRLNSSDDETLDSLIVYFELAKSNHPEFYKDYPYDAYLNFLLSYQLIVIVEDKVSITPIGKDFIKYIIESGYFLDRVF
jgi:hypothetical protein